MNCRPALAVLLLLLTPIAYAIPPNSQAVNSGAGWKCNTGYQRAGGSCRRTVITPATAGGPSAPQACLPGYQRSGGQCRKIDLPANAYRSGSDWACAAGHYRSGGRCRKMDTAVTVTSPPVLDDRCDGGYVEVDGVCRMNVPVRPRLDD